MNKHILLAAAAALAFGLAGTPALAHGSSPCGCTVIDVNLAGSAVFQHKDDWMFQKAFATNSAFGTVGYSNLSSSAVNALNLADVTENVSGVQQAKYMGQGAISLIGQSIDDFTSQHATSLVGTGGLNHSTSASTAANLANVATVSLKISH
jgi:hypothetical protein